MLGRVYFEQSGNNLVSAVKMTPAHELASAQERLRMALKLWDDRKTFAESLSQYGDLQTNAVLKISLLRRIARAKRDVRKWQALCGDGAFSRVR